MATSLFDGDKLEEPKNAPKFLPVLEHALKADNETPIFRLQSHPRFSDIKGHYTHLTVSKNWLVCIVKTVVNEEEQTKLLRYFVSRAIPPAEIVLNKYLAGYEISKIFLDPTGHHLLISLIPRSQGLSADFLYIHGDGPKVRRIEKFKDHKITAVAFNNYFGNETTTGAILLGTSGGLIFETELSQESDKPSYRKQVYDIGLGTNCPIGALEVFRIPNTNKYTLVIAGPDCLYTLQETLRPDEKSWQSIFTSYVNGSRTHVTRQVKPFELKSCDLRNCSLRFFANPNEKYPLHWSCLCGSGIQNGKLSTKVDDDTILLEDNCVKIEFKKFYNENVKFPKFVPTEFHAVLLYPNHLTAVNLLNEDTVYEENIPDRFGNLLGAVRDPFTGQIYVYTSKTVYLLQINEERRHIWQIYMNKGEYDLAEIYAAEDPDQLDIVQTKQAEIAFDEGKYALSAKLYAQTDCAFESVCLRFMELEDKRPIISYVKSRLDTLNLSEHNDHIMVLVVWLTDLYLTQINFPGRSAEDRLQWQKEFDEFMADSLVTTYTRANRETIQNVIAKHADPHNLAQFAIANGDYEEVITQQLGAEQYADALHTLRKQSNMELYYKYTPILMEHMPHETIEVLMSQGRKLQVERLLPTLITLESAKHIEEVIRYLEYAIYNLGSTNEAIHNYILTLYAAHRPDKLIKYLETEGNNYDINYALSICLDNGAKVACVFLQCVLCMWKPAVELALTFDLALAKKTASKPKDEETRRELWLLIAYHDIKGTDDVKKALDLLKECNLLRIEDLLPFFSDFEKIDNFKQPICEALQEYNERLQELQHDMAEYKKQAERARNDLQNVRERSVRIKPEEVCSLCESFLLMKPFFIFGCGHKFHTDCLEKQVIPLLPSEQSRKLTMLKHELDTIIMSQTILTTDSTQNNRREQVKKEIEHMLAADCLYCYLMIETIDQPFVEDWDQVNVDWE